jgi:hypothetical protein
MTRRWRNRRYLSILAAVWIIAAALAWIAVPADAYNPEPCHWPDNVERFIDSSPYGAATGDAVDAWNNDTIIILSPRDPGDPHEISIDAANDGLNGLNGVTYLHCSGADMVCCSNSYYNSFYTAEYSRVERKVVMVHELGHAIGLGHVNHPDCPGMPIMYAGWTRWTECHKQNPQQDDINGISALY